MNFISNRLSRFKPSLTVKISQKAREMTRDGVKVISLSSGEPDFDTPDHIKEFAIKAIKNGFTKYTQVDGTDELKNAIARKFKSENNLNYKNDNITVGVGGKHVIYNLFMSSINEGDEVLIPSPYWVSYPDIVNLCNGKPVIIETKFENGFKVKPEDLEKSITNKTKWFIINSPGNPTGSVYSENELKKLAEIIRKHKNIFILSDDIYEHILYKNVKFNNILNTSPDLFDRTFIVNGVSKVFSMTGWRIGYGAGNKELVKSISKIQSQCTTNPCSISQMAAMFALENEKTFLKDWLVKFEDRKNFLVDFFSSVEGFKPFIPEGAFYLYVSCEGFIGKKYNDNKLISNDLDFSEFLLNFAKVAVVPGVAFGKSPFFRLSYATSLEELKKACLQIEESLKKLS
ncbi:MAG: aspartate aminotransferase [Rickettsiales bacterium]|nr:aspartate aminotransferase [Rickettsiales bacterium]|tara:strand:- start:329 stop:1531 length:1203 start_codon:yes stop_codon:yes gene_type:complete